MFAAATLTTILAILPRPPTSRAPLEFTAEIHRTEAVFNDDVVLYAYDADDHVIGSIALWVDPDGAIVTLADYHDGFAQTTILPSGEVVTESTLPADTVITRAAAMTERLHMDYSPHPQAAGWLGCTLAVAATVISCAGAQPWCPVAGGVAACNCVPLMSEEFEGMTCPGF